MRVDEYGKPTAVVGTCTTSPSAARWSIDFAKAKRATRAPWSSRPWESPTSTSAADSSWCNRRLRELLGYSARRAVNSRSGNISHPEDVAHGRSGSPALACRRNHNADAREALPSQRLHHDLGQDHGRDATNRRRPADVRRRHRRGHHDAQVRRGARQIPRHARRADGLPNRTLFAELLEHAIETAQRYESASARCCSSISTGSRSSTIRLGHEAGDLLLQEVASRLRQCIRKSAVIGTPRRRRIRGAAREPQRSAAAADVARRDAREHARPGQDHGPRMPNHRQYRHRRPIRRRARCRDADEARRLAMYRAKDEGKNNLQVYSTDMSPMSVEHLELEDATCAGAREAGVLAAISAESRHRDRQDQRRGSVAALVERGPRLRVAGTLHPAGGRHGPDRRDRQVGHTQRLRAERGVAEARVCASIVMSVNLSPRQFKDPALLERHRGDSRSNRHAAGAAGARDHRDHDHEPHRHRRGESGGDEERSASSSRSTTSAPAIRRCRSSNAFRSTR